ncbi:serine/threonine-protein kinase [Psychrobacter maritimus]|uniref:serine/threonine-protein kinase n=1 Tax=Psychrobacter maritimus TaxID=256325 RepID=UPI003FCF112D
MDTIYDIGDLIDNKFEVIDFCSDTGGMGRVLHVYDIHDKDKGKLALKYCKETDEEHIRRFRREVRLLEQFSGNAKVVEIFHSNTDYEPPYFVMKFYPLGDLINHISNLKNNIQEQEKIFNLMIDCIAELHAKNIFHRDIKPQNFLLSKDSLVVSDFGLGMESSSSSRFTHTSESWGTQSYMPPEFESGGFKHANEASDIFMLGKSFYALITNKNPTYLRESELNPILFNVIERACQVEPKRRYKNIPELKQALDMAFNVMLGRGGHLGEVSQLISTINDKLENERKYNSSEVIEFVEKLQLVNPDDQIRICLELKQPLILVLTQNELSLHVSNFLNVYMKMVESEQYGWEFSETVARNMKTIFEGKNVYSKDKAKALEIAILAAQLMNRYAAMDTCKSMITSVTNEDLGAYVANVIQANQSNFIAEIEPSQCKSENIRSTIRAIKAA